MKHEQCGTCWTTKLSKYTYIIVRSTYGNSFIQDGFPRRLDDSLFQLDKLNMMMDRAVETAVEGAQHGTVKGGGVR